MELIDRETNNPESREEFRKLNIQLLVACLVCAIADGFLPALYSKMYDVKNSAEFYTYFNWIRIGITLSVVIVSDLAWRYLKVLLSIGFSLLIIGAAIAMSTDQLNGIPLFLIGQLGFCLVNLPLLCGLLYNTKPGSRTQGTILLSYAGASAAMRLLQQVSILATSAYDNDHKNMTTTIGIFMMAAALVMVLIDREQQHERQSAQSFFSSLDHSFWTKFFLPFVLIGIGLHFLMNFMNLEFRSYYYARETTDLVYTFFSNVVFIGLLALFFFSPSVKNHWPLLLTASGVLLSLFIIGFGFTSHHEFGEAGFAEKLLIAFSHVGMWLGTYAMFQWMARYSSFPYLTLLFFSTHVFWITSDLLISLLPKNPLTFTSF